LKGISLMPAVGQLQYIPFLARSFAESIMPVLVPLQ
jgi:hypothetical protein